MSAGGFSISYDDDEHDRIRIERALHDHLPSPDYSIELPRHLPIDDIDQFDFTRSRADDSLFHGDSVSTAAHHASALTLSAGLVPRRHSPTADRSRALNDILHIPPDVSLFNITRTPRSAMPPRHARTPLVVDNTTELDRVLRSGRFQKHHRETDDAVSDVSSARRTTDNENERATTPKLSDALSRHGVFSPKRPRSVPLPLTHTTSTPAPPSRSRSSGTASGAHDSAVSRFESLARGLATDIQREKLGAQTEVRPRRAPFGDIANGQDTHVAPMPAPVPVPVSRPKAKTPARARISRVQLPDVTGLTSAVASPSKSRAYIPLDELPASHLPDSALAIDELSRRLAELERENGAARRRVRELERELDDAKADVVRERTRMHAELAAPRDRSIGGKGKGRANDSADRSATVSEARYREVVEEKKALEALVSSLRAHIARMTVELESHGAQLSALRDTRDYDARELRARRDEVAQLRAEIERLSVEVARLREVVEEGLAERRRAREAEDQRRENERQYQEEERGRLEEEAQERAEAAQRAREEAVWARAREAAARAREEAEAEVQREREDAEAAARELEQEYDDEPPSADGLSAVPEERTADLLAASADDAWAPEHDRRPPSRMGYARPAAHADRSEDLEPASRYIDPHELTRLSADLDERRGERSIGSRTASLEERDRAPRTPAPAPAPADGDSCPRIRGAALERLFFSAPPHNARTCGVCHRRRPGADAVADAAPAPAPARRRARTPTDEGFVDGDGTPEPEAPAARELPPQTVLARVLRELEDDFAHYKAVYVELAEQYRIMDAAAHVPKRNAVAAQLKEVIDVLEQKGDHIAALYDVLRVQDRPLAPDGWAVPPGARRMQYATAARA